MCGDYHNIAAPFVFLFFFFCAAFHCSEHIAVSIIRKKIWDMKAIEIFQRRQISTKIFYIFCKCQKNVSLFLPQTISTNFDNFSFLWQDKYRLQPLGARCKNSALWKSYAFSIAFYLYNEYKPLRDLSVPLLLERGYFLHMHVL